MRKYFLGFLTCLFLWTLVISHKSMAAPAVEAAAEASTQVGVVFSVHPQGLQLLGSAWAVKSRSGYKIVTAQHVGLDGVDRPMLVCSTVGNCIELDPRDAVGPVAGIETHDDWMHWQVEELPEGLDYLQIRRKYKKGTAVCAVGNPLGRIAEYTCGRITNYDSTLMFIDARIMPGNSGGPLLDSQGRVLGMVIAGDVIPGDGFVATSGIVIPVSQMGL